MIKKVDTVYSEVQMDVLAHMALEGSMTSEAYRSIGEVIKKHISTLDDDMNETEFIMCLLMYYARNTSVLVNLTATAWKVSNYEALDKFLTIGREHLGLSGDQD